VYFFSISRLGHRLRCGFGRRTVFGPQLGRNWFSGRNLCTSWQCRLLDFGRGTTRRSSVSASAVFTFTTFTTFTAVGIGAFCRRVVFRCQLARNLFIWSDLYTRTNRRSPSQAGRPPAMHACLACLCYVHDVHHGHRGSSRIDRPIHFELK
jgi:hypothetical protein